MATTRVTASPDLSELPPADVRPARASALDIGRVAARVVVPMAGIGLIKRRPRAMSVAQRLQPDRSAIRLLGDLRGRYGPGPLDVSVPGRPFQLLLDPAQVGRLLADAPTPFSPDTTEKAAALRHFQPHGVLISQGDTRARRRDLNESVLQPGRAAHELAGSWTKLVRDEAQEMLCDGPELDATRFTEHFWAIVRRIVLGGDTTADRRVTDLLGRLRLDANWAYAHPRRGDERRRFLSLLTRQLDLDRPGSLGAAVRGHPADPDLDPVGQVPHWLFAFDAASLVTFRALALLVAHPDELARAHAEADRADLSTPQQLPYLRACVLESIRLWPTTPALLRESTEDTDWGPAGTTMLVYTPFFHRDPDILPYADSFSPDIWLDGQAAANPALVPFSAGPAVCPGRDVVLFTTSTLLAALLQLASFGPRGNAADLRPGRLPATLDHFGIRFALT
ncbi:cytochrome P450 [Amycolatopsis benzoatilytica]|uniref:cytochrome P450 n=1 Tax=Amycolatopsis benzoatilytica TaxID=346045 RepID=UPI0003691A49|nr:cytochrome P450 [Amycolatopsis benzoatilytica]